MWFPGGGGEVLHLSCTRASLGALVDFVDTVGLALTQGCWCWHAAAAAVVNHRGGWRGAAHLGRLFDAADSAVLTAWLLSAASFLPCPPPPRPEAFNVHIWGIVLPHALPPTTQQHTALTPSPPYPLSKPQQTRVTRCTLPKWPVPSQTLPPSTQHSRAHVCNSSPPPKTHPITTTTTTHITIQSQSPPHTHTLSLNTRLPVFADTPPPHPQNPHRDA